MKFTLSNFKNKLKQKVAIAFKTLAVIGLFCIPAVSSACQYRIDMYDSYGDGWNNGYLRLYVGGVLINDHISMLSGAGPFSFEFDAADGDSIRTEYVAGSYRTENLYFVISYNGDTLMQDGVWDESDNPHGGFAGLANCPDIDLSVDAWITPVSTCNLTDSAYVTIRVLNKGNLPQSNFQLAYSVDMGNTIVHETYSQVLNAGDTLIYTFIEPADMSTHGAYFCGAAVIIAGDEITSNDTLQVAYPIYNSVIHSSFPFNEDFENGMTAWFSYGTSSSWEIGNPNKSQILSAASGDSAWVTNLTSSYNSNELSYLESPCFDFSSNSNPIVDFKLNYYTYGSDGLVLQYSTDGLTWQVLSNEGYATNWYSSWSDALDQKNINNGFCWSGSTGGEWIAVKNRMTFLAGQSLVKFRFVFASDASWNSYDGFAMDDFKVYDAPRMYLKEQLVGHPTLDYVTPGESDVQMLVIDLLTESYINPISTTRFNFSSAGTTDTAVVDSATLYYTHANDYFYHGVQFGNKVAVSQHFSFTDTLALGEGHNYFWLVFDQVDDTVVGPHFLDAHLVSVVADDTLNYASLSDTAGSREIARPLSGIYTIAQSGTPDFNSFTEAVTALQNKGIEGPVTFKVGAGVYNEQIALNSITGSSTVNTITFTPADDDSTSVTLTYASTTSTNNYTIFVNGADHVTFEKMQLVATGVSFARVIAIAGYADSTVFKSCTIVGNTTTSTSTNFALVYSSSYQDDHTTFRNNTFVNGSYGLYLTGYESGTSIVANSFYSQYYSAIYLQYQQAAEIKNNVIYTETNYYNFQGIFVDSGDNYLSIENNWIGAPSSQGGAGIFLNYMNETDTLSSAHVVNNMISINTTSSPAYGIYMYYQTRTDVLHNSINITGSGTNSVGGYFYYTGANTRVLNNIFKNNASGNAIYYTGSLAIVSDYNVLYTAGTVLAYFNSSLATLADIRNALNKELHSLQTDPMYLSDLDLRTHASALKGQGTAVNVLKDIEGDNRDLLHPDIGADEFDLISNEAALLGIESPVSGCSLSNENVTIKIKNLGALQINGNLTASYRLNGGAVVTQSVTGIINTNDTLAFTFTTKVNLTALGKDSTYSLLCWIELIGDTLNANDTLTSTVTSGYTPFEPLVTGDVVNFGEQAELKAISVEEDIRVLWYNQPIGGSLILSDTVLTTQRLSQTTTYYVQSGGLSGLSVDTLVADNFVLTDVSSYTGDDRGGIAVTDKHIYVQGDNAIVRYNLPDFTSPASYARNDGFFSDLKSGKLYTLWNGTDVPAGISTYTVTGIKRLNADMTQSAEVINLSSPITLSTSYGHPGIFAGYDFVVIYNSTNTTQYKVNLTNGEVTTLGTYPISMRSSESWIDWGVAEYDGDSYSLLYRPSSGNQINRIHLSTGAITNAAQFTNLSDMASFTVSPWLDKWFLFFEGGSEFAGSSEALVMADATLTSNSTICSSSRLPVTATVTNTPPLISMSNDTLLFSNVMQWSSKTDTVFIHNTGGDTLKIFSITTGNSLFTTPDTTFILLFSDQIGKIPVTFSPLVGGTFYSTLNISNNDKDTSIVLKGLAYNAPQYNCTIDSIVVNSSVCSDTIIVPLQLTNTGDTTLQYSVSVGLLSGSSKGNVLLIGTDPTFLNILTAEGYTVTNVQNYNYNGTNPSLNNYKAVVLSGGNASGYNMPVNGQTALLNFVQNGGGFISTEWSTYEIYYGRYAQMLDLFPIRSTNTYSNSQTLTKIGTHAITNGLPNSFALPYSGYTNSTLQSGTQILSGTSSPIAAAVKDVGSGRVVQYGFTGYSASYDPFVDANVKQLFINSLDWVTYDTWCSASIDTDSLLKQDTSIVEIKIATGRLKTNTYQTFVLVQSNDPLHAKDTIPVTLVFQGKPELQVLSTSFDSIFQYSNVVKNLSLSNLGCDTLFIDSLTKTSAHFTLLDNINYIVPDSSKTVRIRFEPTITGTINDMLYVYTNDIDTTIQLQGYALSPPVINVLVDTVQAQLVNCNDSITQTVGIYNSGDTTLIYSLQGVLNANAIDVLLVAGDPSSAYNDVKAKLNATGKFKSVTVFDARLGTPTLSYLQQFDAILVWSASNYSNSTTLGNVMADYVDGGGGVVSAVFETAYSNCMQGRWNTSQYYIINRNNYKEGSASLGVKAQPNHFILRDVNTFHGGIGSYRPSTAGLTSGGTLIASWNDGMPLVTEKRINGQRRVDLGFYPASSSLYSDYWNSATDGAKIMANALLYVAEADAYWLSTDKLNDTITKGDTAYVSVTFKSDDLIKGNYYSTIIINSNDPVTPIDTLITKLVFNGQAFAQFSKDSSAIGSIFKFDTRIDSLYINNVGCDTLKINSVLASDSDLQAQVSKTTIIPGDSAKLIITFNPSVAGNYAETIQVSTSAGNTSVDITALVLNPPVLHFDTDTLSALASTCLDTLTKSLKVKNNGDTTLYIAYTMPGEPSNFSLITVYDTILAHDSSEVKIYFEASGQPNGVYIHPVYITSNDPLHSKDTIILKLIINGAATISLLDTAADLDSVMQFTSRSFNLIIYNNGCADLNISKITSTHGDITLGDSTLYIAPFDNNSLQVVFSPLTLGLYQDTITLFSNADTVEFVLTGLCVPPPVFKSDIVSITTSISSCNDTLDIPVKIWNEGVPKLQVSWDLADQAMKPSPCNPGNSHCCGMGITRVMFGSINHVSANGSEGYQDNSAIQVATVDRGKTYTLSVTTGNVYSEYAGAWIDFNNDGSFSSEERVLNDYTLATHTAQVTIPENTPVNKPLRMRIMTDYYSKDSGCDIITYGQAEDYGIIIRDGFHLTNENDTIASGDTTTFTLRIKASELTEGINMDTLTLQTNDPLQYLVKIPYQVTKQSAPHIPVTAGATMCFGDAVPALIAAGSTIKWYSDEDGGVDTLMSLNDSLVFSITAPGTYMAHVTNTDMYGCESQDTTVELEVFNIPAQPMVTDNTVCAGQAAQAIMYAVMSSNVKWYNDAALTQLAGSGDTLYTGKTMPGVYTYYFTQTTGACTSFSDTATLTVHENPLKPDALDTMACYGSEIPKLTAEGTALKWYSNGTLTVLMYSGDSLNTGKTSAGTYNYFVTQTDTITGCTSAADTSTLAIRFTPAPTAASQTICEGQTVPVLTATGNNIRWYNDALLDSLIIINDTLVTGKSTSGVYTFYAVQTDSLAGCESPARTVLLTINAIPSKPVVANKQVCFGQAVPNLSTTGTNVKWYSDVSLLSQVHAGTSYATGNTNAGTYSYYITQTVNGCVSSADTATLRIDSLPSVPSVADVTVCSGAIVPDFAASGDSIRWYGDAGLTSKLKDGSTFTTGKTNVGVYSYYVTQTSPLSGCQSPSTMATLTIDTLPAAPLVQDEQVCEGAVVPPLVATGTSIKWYADSTLLTQVYAGDSLQTGKTLANTYTYYAIQTTGCGNSLTAKAILTIKPRPAAPSGIDTAVCAGTLIPDLQATGTGITWYSDKAMLLPVATGNTFATGQITPGVYTYYVTQTQNNCAGSADSVKLTIHALPLAPATTSATICVGETVPNLTATGANIRWYDNITLPIALFTGDTFTTNKIAAGIYTYYVTETNAEGCQSAASTSVLRINAIPNAPSVSDKQVCFGMTTPDLQASGQNIIWYTDSLKGMQAGLGNNLITNKLAVGAYSYFASQTVSGCESPLSKATLTIKALPVAPTTSDISVCAGETVPPLVATGSSVKWYSDATIQNLIATNDTLITGKTIAGNYVYYSTNTDLITGCTSPSDTTTLTIQALPAAPLLNDAAICFGDTIPTFVTIGDSIKWYKDSTLDTLIIQGTTYQPVITKAATYTYYATSTSNQGCVSQASLVTLTVNATPIIDSLTSVNESVCNIGDGEIKLYATGATGLTYSIDGGLTYAAQSDYTTLKHGHYPTAVIAANGCAVLGDTIVITSDNAPNAPTANNAQMCYGETIPVLVANGQQIKWYSDPQLTQLLVANDTLINAMVQTGVNTFYVTQTSMDACESVANLVTLTAHVTPAPSVTNKVARVNHVIPSLTASGTELNWYADIALTTLLFSGDVFNTGKDSVGVYTFYVTQTDTLTGCVSAASTVTLTILDKLAAPVVSDIAICEGKPVPSLNASGYQPQWFSDSTLTSLVHIGNAFTTTHVMSGMYPYWVAQTDSISTEPGLAAKVTLTIYAKPSAPLVADVKACSGEFLQLEAASNATVWYDQTNTILDTSNTLTLILTTGMHTFYADITQNGCSSERDTTIVTISAQPLVDSVLVTDASTCSAADASITIYAQDVSLLSYSIDNGQSYLQNAGVYTSLNKGSYIVVVKNASGCVVKYDTVTISSSDLPAAPLVADTAICFGAPAATLTATGTGITWYADALLKMPLIASNTYTPIVTPVANYIYYATQTIGGCEGLAAAVHYTVKSLPTAVVVSPVSVCEGLVVPPFTATGSAIRWYADINKDSLVHQGLAYTANETNAGSYDYFVTQEINACESEPVKVKLDIHALPAAPVTSDMSVCEGSYNASLLASGSSSIRWYAATDLITPVAMGPAFTPSVTEPSIYTYYLNTTDAMTGCISKFDTVVYTINAVPSSPWVADTSICSGNAYPVLSDTTGASITWYSDSLLMQFLHTGTSYNPSSLEIGVNDFYITKTNSQTGCISKKARVDVTLHNSPTITSVTAVDETTCNSMNGMINIVATDVSTLKYSINGGADYSISSIITALTHGAYPVVVKNSHGCLSFGDTVVISAGDIPVKPTTTNAAICAGSPAETLTASGIALQWYSDILLKNQVGLGNTFTSLETIPGTYTYYVTQTQNTCEGLAASATYTIHALPSAPVVPDVVNCAAIASPVINANGMNTVHWFSSDVLTTKLFTGHMYMPGTLASGVYNYFVLQHDSATGCSSAVTKTTLTNSLPATPVVTDQSVCMGGILSPLSSTGNNVQWYADNSLTNLVATGNTFDTKRSKVGTDKFYVIQKDSLNCRSQVEEATATIHPQPLVTLNKYTEQLVKGTSTVLQAYNASTYRWSPKNALSDTAGSAVTAAPVADVTYTVTGTSSLGCTNTASVSITVVTDVNDIAGHYSIHLWPNPSSDFVYVSMQTEIASRYALQLYNEQGQLIISREVNTASQVNEAFDISQLAQGTYQLRIVCVEKPWQITKQIIIQK